MRRPGHRRKVSLDLGPQPGFVLNADYRRRLYSPVTGQTTSENHLLPRGSYNSFDVGVLFGATYLLTDRIDFSVRYIWGLRPVAHGDNDTAIRNRAFQFTVGTQF